jgi:hypothetical protein
MVPRPPQMQVFTRLVGHFMLSWQMKNTYIMGNQGLDLSFEPLPELVLFQEHHLSKV